MATTIDRIIGYAEAIDASLEGDAVFAEVVAEAVDRAVIFMGREESENLFPPILERPMASACIRAYKTFNNILDSDGNAVSSIKDHGQSIHFSDKLQTFLSGMEDEKIFSSMYDLLVKFRLAKVIGN
jgi:hypothetical protein